MKTPGELKVVACLVQEAREHMKEVDRIQKTLRDTYKVDCGVDQSCHFYAKVAL